MAVFHGKTAYVDFSASAIASSLGWTMSVTGDVAEKTVSGDTFKSFEPGFTDVSATCDCNAMTEDTTQVGTNAALKLYVDGTNYFHINTAVCVEQTETASVTDVGKTSYSFASDDADTMVYA